MNKQIHRKKLKRVNMINKEKQRPVVRLSVGGQERSKVAVVAQAGRCLSRKGDDKGQGLVCTKASTSPGGRRGFVNLFTTVTTFGSRKRRTEFSQHPLEGRITILSLGNMGLGWIRRYDRDQIPDDGERVTVWFTCQTLLLVTFWPYLVIILDFKGLFSHIWDGPGRSLATAKTQRIIYPMLMLCNILFLFVNLLSQNHIITGIITVRGKLKTFLDTPPYQPQGPPRSFCGRGPHLFSVIPISQYLLRIGPPTFFIFRVIE